MHESLVLRTLKCDRNTLAKPSDEDASRGGGSAMFRKFSPRAVAQEFICLRQQRTTRLDGDRNEVVPSNEVASTRMNRSTLHTLKCGRNTLPKHDEKHPARSRYQSVTLCQQCLCMVFRASGDIARSHFIHNDYCLSFLSCDCVQSSFSGMVALT